MSNIDGDTKIETIAVHAGAHIDPSTGAIAAPIHLSTTFLREADGSYPKGYSYTRVGNPTRSALEECLALLEGGAAAGAFSSGSAATMSLLQALSPGDHVILPKDMYYAVARMIGDILVPWGLEVLFIDMDTPAQVEAALHPNTRLVWLETPSNPMMKIVDIRGVAEIAHGAGALCVVDSTFTTPILQRPLDLGADLVVHSTSKYLGGHSDVLGGAVIAKAEDDLLKRIRLIQQSGGAVPSPFDCWLVLRGIRTLPYRMRAQTEHAVKIANFLQKHPAVKRVHYPGLKDHPSHHIAAQQMAGFGPMLSFEVRRGDRAAVSVAAWVRLFTRATSLGAVESLIEHRASIEGADTRTPGNLLRLSIGLENPDDLINDLKQALDQVQSRPPTDFFDVPKRK
jgi:cystathionine gamma-synthase